MSHRGFEREIEIGERQPVEFDDDPEVAKELLELEVAEVEKPVVSEAALPDLHLVRSLKSRGDQLLLARKWEDAITAYTSAIELYSSGTSFFTYDPLLVTICANLAYTCARVTDYVNCILNLTRAINMGEQAPTPQVDVKLLLRRAMVYKRTKRYEESLEDFSSVKNILLSGNETIQKSLPSCVTFEDVEITVERLQRRIIEGVLEEITEEVISQQKIDDGPDASTDLPSTLNGLADTLNQLQLSVSDQIDTTLVIQGNEELSQEDALLNISYFGDERDSTQEQRDIEVSQNMLPNDTSKFAPLKLLRRRYRTGREVSGTNKRNGHNGDGALAVTRQRKKPRQHAVYTYETLLLLEEPLPTVGTDSYRITPDSFAKANMYELYPFDAETPAR